MASIHARLKKFKDAPWALFDPHAVDAACRAVGHRWRHRVLDPLRTLQVFAAQIAHGNTAISHLVRLEEGAFTESAYCQARARLPVAVVRAVFDAGTARVAGGSSGGSWRGHRAVLIDGTGIATPDTPELRATLGVPNGPPPGSGLPCAKVLAIFDAHRGLLLDLHAAPAHAHDLSHAADLHPALRRGDVLVGDRGLCSYVHLALLMQAGMHGVFRMPGTRGMPFPARRGERRRLKYNRHRRHEPILERLIGDDDQVVQIVKPHNRPGHLTPERFAAIPGTMTVRVVRFHVEAPGARTRRIVLLTDLTDTAAYPAAELARLYLTRWRIETNFRHLKRTLGMDRLKCRSLQGVGRELLMYALVYNTVCAVRERAAAAQRVEPFRLSFVDSLRWLLLAVTSSPTPPTLKRWPLRPPRIQPRGLKRRPSTFPILRQPRQEIIRQMTPYAYSTN